MVPLAHGRRVVALVAAAVALALGLIAALPSPASAQLPCLVPVTPCPEPQPSPSPSPTDPSQPAPTDPSQPSQPAESSQPPPPATPETPTTANPQSIAPGSQTSSACPPQGTNGRGFIGVTAQDVLLDDTTFRECSLNALAAAHVRVLREAWYWASIETSPGEYDFAAQDDYVANAARRRMTVLPVLLWAPNFRSSAPATGARRGFYPPQNPSDIGTFATALVKRYGPHGSFWDAHPSLPYFPVRSWQIWNEPNLPAYWPSGPNPAEYAALLRSASGAIRAVDAQAEIVTAGLPYSADRRTMSPEQFLQGMYAAGAKGTFTTLAVHPYSDTVKRMVVALARMRRVLKRNGDGRASIWVTEVGWATGGPRSVFTVGRKRQAKLIAESVRVLSHKRRALRLRGLVIYNLRDSRPSSGDHDYWAFHAGLFDLSGRPKPAVSSLKVAARKL